MLAVEATLLAIVGVAIVVLAGIGYGWVGAASAFGEADEDMVLNIPRSQLGVILLLAVAAAVLASVLPARRPAQATHSGVGGRVTKYPRAAGQQESGR